MTEIVRTFYITDFLVYSISKLYSCQLNSTEFVINRTGTIKMRKGQSNRNQKNVLLDFGPKICNMYVSSILS